MADGDYERGRGRELAAISATLRKLAAARRTHVMVLNGLAASEEAWALCRFRRDFLFSYVDQLAGRPERAFAMTAGTFVLVGWSMGGSTALRLAAAYPEKIAGLVLLAATPRMMMDEATGWRGMTPRRLEALRHGIEMTQGGGFFGVPDGKPNPYCADSPDNLEAGLRYLLETDVRADLLRVFEKGASFPVAIFQSERDGIVRPENASWLKSLFPQAALTWIPGAEHALPIWIPDPIAHAVEGMLERGGG